MSDLQRSETTLKSFNDHEMAFQLLRGLGVAGIGGGSLGEIMAITRNIPDGDVAAWVDEYEKMAEQVLSEAGRADAAGHALSASDLRQRASMYLRAAEYFEPVVSERHRRLGCASRDAFTAALPQLRWPAEALRIPFGDVKMPGYFMSAGDAGRPRPTIIVNGGFDSSAEEVFFQFGIDALRRGMNVLTFDGPGQTGMQRDGHTVFPTDWENVLSAVVDHALSRDDVDEDRLGLVGISLGGYFAMRGLTREKRFAAACLNSPVPDLRAYLMAFVPEPLHEPFLAMKRTDIENPDSEESRETPRSLRANLLQTFHRFHPTAETCSDLMDRIGLFRLEPEEIAAIDIPVLAAVGAGEGPLPLAQCDAFSRCASGPVTKVVFTADWGADSHCQVTNVQYLGQVVYDWFTDRFAD